MSSVFLLQNQARLLLSKQGEWVDGRDAGSLYRSAHRDEALNQMVEINARDHTLRIRLLECSANERGQPRIEPEDLPPLMPSSGQGAAANDDPTLAAAADRPGAPEASPG